MADAAWGWSYGLSGDSLTYTRAGANSQDNGDGTFTGNIVFTNIGPANFGTQVYARLNFSATVNGKQVTWTDEVRSRSVDQVARAIVDDAQTGTAAYIYASALLGDVAQAS